MTSGRHFLPASCRGLSPCPTCSRLPSTAGREAGLHPAQGRDCSGNAPRGAEEKKPACVISKKPVTTRFGGQDSLCRGRAALLLAAAEARPWEPRQHSLLVWQSTPAGSSPFAFLGGAVWPSAPRSGACNEGLPSGPATRGAWWRVQPQAVCGGRAGLVLSQVTQFSPLTYCQDAATSDWHWHTL